MANSKANKIYLLANLKPLSVKIFCSHTAVSKLSAPNSKRLIGIFLNFATSKDAEYSISTTRHLCFFYLGIRTGSLNKFRLTSRLFQGYTEYYVFQNTVWQYLLRKFRQRFHHFFDIVIACSCISDCRC